MNNFDLQLQVEDLEMEERLYYNIDTDDYITEEELRKEYYDYIDDEDNECISFAEFINISLVINDGNLEKVGF